MEGEVEKIIDEELESIGEIETKRRILNRIKSFIKNGNQTLSARRSMKLVFRNRISRTILTGEEIKGENKGSIEVALIDGSNGNVVNGERESSSNVEIVLVKGEFDAPEGEEWTVEEFEANIVPEMEGKRPILAGNIRLKLHRGIGILDNIKLRHHTSEIKHRSFRLGARVVDTFDRARVKEAMTERFIVKNFRNKYKEKHENPSSSDKVWRLVYIRKDGPIHRRLESDKIFTVEDFLIRLLINPEGLKSIVNLRGKKWEDIVNNAQACKGDKRMYCYINSQKNTGVVFNILGHVLGLFSKNQYFTSTMLSENQKVDAQELLASAYKHWEYIVYFDDEGSLQQHFTSLSMPEYTLVGQDNCYGEIGAKYKVFDLWVGATKMPQKRQHREEGTSFDDGRQRKIPEFKRLVLDVMNLQKLQSFMEPVMEPLIRRVVKEDVDLALRKYIISMQRNSGRDINPSESRILQLKFFNGISLPVFAGNRIEGEGCTNMEVALVNTITGQVVSSGQGSSSMVEIVALEGDFDGDDRDNWTLEEFRSNIVRAREGKTPLLTGDVIMTLKHGRSLVGDVSFTDNSSWTRSRKFRLGARLLDNIGGTRVREARSEPFVVRDHRGECEDACELVISAFGDRDKIVDDDSFLNWPTSSNLCIVPSPSSLKQNASSPDFMRSIYSAGGFGTFDDCLDGIDQPLAYPGQVSDSLICDADAMTRANEHLQYFGTDCSNLDISFICDTELRTP